MSNQTISSIATKQIVLDFIEAMNQFDYEKAKTYVTNDLSFVGVLGTRSGADAYLNDMQKMRFQYKVIKAFADGDDVCLIYDINMGEQTIFCFGWYQLQNDKIKSFRVVFDPRPLLEKK
jgi:hypothetical protein